MIHTAGLRNVCCWALLTALVPCANVVAQTAPAQSPAVKAPATAAKRESSVGLPVRIEQLVLPGTELEAKPLSDRDAKVVLRIVSAYPHGTAFRYDLEYYGLEPGQFDLRDYLKRKDASASDDLPPIPVKIVSALPAGQILPGELQPVSPPWVGGYVLVLLLGAVVWIAGLIALIFMGRKKRKTAVRVAEHQLTLAERLQPLVESALAGRLTLDQQAALERLLLGYWSERLGLTDVDPAEAMQRLRSHPEAGQLLRQVEAWLHQPGGAREVNLAQMLAPYRGASAGKSPGNSPFAAVVVAEEVAP